MSFHMRFILLVVLLQALACAEESTRVDFDAEIRPLLADRCFACHGPDESARQADLRLDLEEGANAAAIVPGDADASELVRRIRSDDPDERMPPPDSHRSLNAAETRRIEAWIDQGARWSRHWSFVPPRASEVPCPSDGTNLRYSIDCFVRKQLAAEGWQPAAPTDRATLLRRMTFSLTGLPPTLDELDAFLADEASDACEKVVDRLLASPRYGERMAVVWLDAARYSDTYGYQVDRDRFVWPYRDWVVRAFNRNMPYDQFVTEQLAGDLLPDATDEQILATTFNRLHPQEAEGGSIPEEFRLKSVADRTETFATALLGLTMECCRCHDHKFDPIDQKEYYQLSAFFDNIDEAGLYSYFTDAVPTPTLLLSTDEQRARQAELRTAMNAAESGLLAIRTMQIEALSQRPMGSVSEQIDVPPPLAHLDFEAPPTPPNEAVPGVRGQAVRLTGDDGIVLDVGNFHAYEPFSVALWMRSPGRLERAVIFHRSRAWTDAGSRGYELLMEEGRLQFALIHFWPGNAIAIKSQDELPVNQWQHVTVTYDGSSRADGMAMYIHGQRVAVEAVRDQLDKDITGGGGDTITIGERFRDHGFRAGLIDEFCVFDRCLSSLEVAFLAKDDSFASAKPNVESPQSPVGVFREDDLLAGDETYQQRFAELRDLRRQWVELLTEVPEIMVMRELPLRRPSHVRLRGDYDALGEAVLPRTPRVLGQPESVQPANRLGLARWLTRANHPLTARVQVNRIWQMLFGQGLVRTPEDFGQQGERPTHPDLLDWLACDFVEHGWDVKRLVKQIVMSETFAQSSRVPFVDLERDPANRLLRADPVIDCRPKCCATTCWP